MSCSCLGTLLSTFHSIAFLLKVLWKQERHQASLLPLIRNGVCMLAILLLSTAGISEPSPEVASEPLGPCTAPTGSLAFCCLLQLPDSHSDRTRSASCLPLLIIVSSAEIRKMSLLRVSRRIFSFSLFHLQTMCSQPGARLVRSFEALHIPERQEAVRTPTLLCSGFLYCAATRQWHRDWEV